MAHEPGGGFGENRFWMGGNMVAVRMAHEDVARLAPMRIQPKAKAGQMNAALMIFERQR